MSVYHTRQKEELAKLLESATDRHLTVVDICALLRRRRKAVGTTTVCRQLEKMVAEGTVRTIFYGLCDKCANG